MKNYKKLFIWITVAVTLIVGGFLYFNQKSENQAQTTQIDTSDWKTYRNEEYGFEFKYPANYQINIKDDTFTFNEITDPREDVWPEFASIKVISKPSDWYDNHYKVDYIKSVFDISFITGEITDTKIGTYDALKFVVPGHSHWAIITRDKYVFLMAYSYDKFLEGLKFTK